MVIIKKYRRECVQGTLYFRIFKQRVKKGLENLRATGRQRPTFITNLNQWMKKNRIELMGVA